MFLEISQNSQENKEKGRKKEETILHQNSKINIIVHPKYNELPDK